jgi:cytochrome c5
VLARRRGGAGPFAQERAGFTAVQSEQGAVIYERSCSSCHGPDLRGGAEAPPLSGASFVAKWRPTMMIELYRVTVQTMPPNRPGSLSEAEALAVDAFILQRNGAVPGTRPLSAGAQLRIGVLLDPASASGQPTGGSAVAPAENTATAAAAARLTALRAPLARLMPVTDAMLRDPAPDDWLMWRRTYDNWGHSLLAEDTWNNVPAERRWGASV